MDVSAAHGHVPRADVERREAPRWVPGVRCPARVTSDGAQSDGALVDLSASGACLEVRDARRALAPGRHVELEFALGPHAHRRSARVVWSSTADAARTGVVFDAPLAGHGEPALLDLASVRVDPALALRAPAQLCFRRRLLPLCVVDGVAQVACADPRDALALEALSRHLGMPVCAQAADPEAIADAQKRILGEPRGARATSLGDDPVALVDEMLRAAWLRRASDVHVDPEREGLRIRLRVDGELEEYRRLPARLAPELLSRIKVLAGMDIAERRAPQDGRFTHAPDSGAQIDLRVATLPTKHGERATLRLLAIDAESLTLENLGMSPAHLATFEAAIARPHGLVLATGPTGCGKTTTLYAGLRRILATRAVNAIAVQDPVEVDLPGVAHVEVDAAQKVTFEKALRSILRHDPDVILIGEVRDRETAQIAIQAALTGHVVLATLHTNSAAGALTRLVDMGVDRYLVAATLRLSVSQRLVRRLCPYCREPSTLDASAARLLGRSEAAGSAAFVPRGCVFCAGRGFLGRAGVFELLPLDEELARAVAGGAEESELAASARSRGTQGIAADALDKIASGTTSVREALGAVSA